MNGALARVTVPDADEARDRSWQVVRSAYLQREPLPRRSHARPLMAAIAVCAAAAALAVASPPGRAVIDHVREAVGVDRAQPALFALPAPGSLLVKSDDGLWVVRQDGSKRRLGTYREASWSPFGRFIVATRTNELAALEPDGDVRWTLARPNVSSPRWTGTRTDTRIAYVDRTGIRIVAGDGTGDHLLAPGAHGRIAWRPGNGFALAYLTPTNVTVTDTTTGKQLWRAPRSPGNATALAWSDDGQRLLVLTPYHLRVYTNGGQLVAQEDPSEGWPDLAATFRPGTHDIAVSRSHGSRSSVYLLNGRSMFEGTGQLDGLAWSPNGRWLLASWPTADQWLFLHATSARRIRAIANVTAQFRGRLFPQVEGWCCTNTTAG